MEHRPSTTPCHRTLFWAALAIPVQLVPCCFSSAFSVAPPTVARPDSLPLPLRVPGQGLACGFGCWFPEGVSDPAPLPPQYLLGHWFLLSRSLTQIFISDLLLPTDCEGVTHALANASDTVGLLVRVSDNNDNKNNNNSNNQIRTVIAGGGRLKLDEKCNKV